MPPEISDHSPNVVRLHSSKSSAVETKEGVAGALSPKVAAGSFFCSPWGGSFFRLSPAKGRLAPTVVASSPVTRQSWMAETVVAPRAVAPPHDAPARTSVAARWRGGGQGRAGTGQGRWGGGRGRGILARSATAVTSLVTPKAGAKTPPPPRVGLQAVLSPARRLSLGQESVGHTPSRRTSGGTPSSVLRDGLRIEPSMLSLHLENLGPSPSASSGWAAAALLPICRLAPLSMVAGRPRHRPCHLSTSPLPTNRSYMSLHRGRNNFVVSETGACLRYEQLLGVGGQLWAGGQRPLHLSAGKRSLHGGTAPTRM